MTIYGEKKSIEFDYVIDKQDIDSKKAPTPTMTDEDIHDFIASRIKNSKNNKFQVLIIECIFNNFADIDLFREKCLNAGFIVNELTGYSWDEVIGYEVIFKDIEQYKKEEENVLKYRNVFLVCCMTLSVIFVMLKLWSVVL
ncbi:MAG: hypothetical protein ACRC5M_00270 [Anaeroplasmataceae bacterium]